MTPLKKIIYARIIYSQLLVWGCIPVLFATTNPDTDKNSEGVTEGENVSLVNYNAEEVDGNFHLAWEASHQSDVKYFVVYRSSNGQHFTVLDSVPAKMAGSGEEALQYNVVDADPYFGVNHYRIGYVMNDGSKTTLEDLKVESSTSFHLYPTSIHGNEPIVFEQTNLPKAIHVTATSKSGGSFHLPVVVLGDGNIAEIETEKLPNGIYTLKIVHSDSMWTVMIEKH